MGDVRYQVNVDTDGAVRNVNRLTQAEQELDRSFERTTTTGIALGAAIGTMAGQLGTQLLGSLVRAGPEMLALGDRVNDVRDAFKNLSAKGGADASQFLESLKTATKGAINNLDLMATANDAMIAGLKPETLTQAANAAKQFADATGQDAASALSALSNALQTGNERVLKQYGILIDSKQILADYGKEAGLSGEQIKNLSKNLDEGTKLALTRAEAEKQLAEKFKETADAAGTGGAGDALERLQVALQNAMENVAAAIDSNESLAGTFDLITETIENTDFSPIIENINSLILKAGEAAKAMISFGEAVAAAVGGGVTLNEKGSALAQLARDVNKLDDAVKGAKSKQEITKLAAAFEVLDKTVKESGLGQSQFAGALELVKKHLDAQNATLPETVTETKKTTSASEELKKKLQELALQHNDTGEATSKAKEKLTEYEKAQKEVRETISHLLGNDGLPALRLQFEQVFQDRYVKAPEYMAQQLESMADEALKAGASISAIKDALEKAANAGSDTPKTKGSGGKPLAEILFPDLDGEAQGIAQQIISTITSALAQVGQAILSGDVLHSSDWANITSSMASSIADAVVPGTGPIADLLVDSLFSAFSDSDSAGTKARKQADAFFADIFNADRLSVVIDGQLTRISDLVFKGNQDSGIFSALPAAAQQAYQGVGAAFESILGITSDLGVNVAAVLANNLGGSLNNLGVLLQTTGKSAEELGNAIVDSALNGEMSFLDAQSALDGVAKAMEKGIPDAVGAVSTAFDNLKASSAQGGRFSVDALRDIGHEALELHAHTIPEAIEALASTGKYTVEELEKFRKAAEAFGITTSEQLENVSDKTAIAILANLQAAQFPFAELKAKIDDITKAVNAIPQKIEREIRFKVKAEYEGNTEQILNTAGVDTGNGIPSGPSPS